MPPPPQRARPARAVPTGPTLPRPVDKASWARRTPFYAPIYPDAGPDYFGKWLSGHPDPSRTGAAGAEAIRRELVPSNGYPPERNDHWRDKRPGPKTPQPPVLAPAAANDGAKQISGVVGSGFDQADANLGGSQDNHSNGQGGAAAPGQTPPVHG